MKKEPPKPPPPSSSATNVLDANAADDEITSTGVTDASRASLVRSLRLHIHSVISPLNDCLAALDKMSAAGGGPQPPVEKGLARKLTRANMSIRFIDKAANALLEQLKPSTPPSSSPSSPSPSSHK